MARRKNLSFSFFFFFSFFSLSFPLRLNFDFHWWSKRRGKSFSLVSVQAEFYWRREVRRNEQKIRRMSLSLSLCCVTSTKIRRSKIFLPAWAVHYNYAEKERERTQRMSCVCLIRLLTPNTRTKLQSLLFDTQKRQREREAQRALWTSYSFQFNSALVQLSRVLCLIFH